MPANKNAPDAGQGIEGNETTTSIHEGSSSMTTVPNRHPHPPLADWDATSLIMQATDEGRTVSELLAEILADDAAAKRAARWELAGNLALTVLALIVTYCTVIGAVEILVSLGVSA